MMKQTNMMVLCIITVCAIGYILYDSSIPNYGIDLSSMEAIIGHQANIKSKTSDIIIYDLIVKDDCKIVAFTTAGQPAEYHTTFGYAIFQANENDDYVFKTSYVKTSDRPDIIVDFYPINDIMYDIIICNQPDLSGAKRIVEQTGEETYIEIEDGHAIVLMEQPDLAEINAHYCVYDRNGNIIE